MLVAEIAGRDGGGVSLATAAGLVRMKAMACPVPLFLQRRETFNTEQNVKLQDVGLRPVVRLTLASPLTDKDAPLLSARYRHAYLALYPLGSTKCPTRFYFPQSEARGGSAWQIFRK